MTNTYLLILASAGLLTFSQISRADVTQPPLPMDLPTVVQATTDFDNSTHLYRYTYSLGNPSTNARGIWLLMLQLQPGVDVVTDAQSPSGWSTSAGPLTLSWAATKTTPPANYVDDGNVLPGDAIVQPGSQLTGFSFRSFSAPGTGTAITQAFAPIPAADDADDLSGMPYESTRPEENGYRQQVTMPVPDADWSGNRRRAVDNFLVFANAKDKTSFTGSALIVVRFAAGGETVTISTFKATLNGQDVTSMFQQSDVYKGLAATFVVGSSSIQFGTNKLLTAVDGIVPGTTDHTATDHDSLTFTLNP